MKAPRKLKEDVSNKFPCLFLEKKVNKTKFESAYDTKPQIAVAGTKHTITTNENKIIHRKRVSKPLNYSFQNPLCKRGEISRGPDGRFTALPIQPETSEEVEQLIKESTPILDESVLETTMISQTETSPTNGRGKRKQVRDRNAQKSPGQPNLQMCLENLTETGDINNVTPKTEEDPDVITVTDKNGNTDLIKIEKIEYTNQNNNNEPTTRKSARNGTVNPIIRYGNPIIIGNEINKWVKQYQ